MHSWVLRAWEERRTEPGFPATWRFSLEAARTGERRAFRSLEVVQVFLKSCLKQEND